MSTARPFALRLFVPSGLPEGMRIVEKTNWSGIGYVIPRSQLKEFTQRDEAARPGVYVLSGPDPEGGADLVYIGEADPLGRRLEQHQAREFWTTAYAFTSKDGYLNKAHAQHLEARLIRLAQAAKRCRLENAVQGRSITLAEMDRAVAEGFRVAVADGFLEELLLCCPVLGLRAFEQATGKPAQANRRLFHLKGPGASGQGFESPGGFTVLRGARARSEFVESTPPAWVQARAQLVSQGVFLQEPTGLTLAQDYEFNSPSQAAMALLARTANGRIEWKDAKGVTLKEHQEQAAAAASAEGEG
ncbi:MAG: GIY-YIG nuclease family protein [Cyanobium sp. PLM2.Bin73]|nr:MAG: GIY-YIG nuclease family protein [Cyanobium sp. PLM2.Bin73]